MRNQSRRNAAAVNAGSMADIAFLLLIFFLVATTIARDQGVEVVLPPYYDGEPGKMADRNVLDILINAEDQLLIEGELATSKTLLNDLKSFITNPERRSDLPVSPKQAVISIRHHAHTSYDAYVNIYSIVKQAYIELRETEALRRYGHSFGLCNAAQRNDVRLAYPLRISEAEPFSEIAHQ